MIQAERAVGILKRYENDYDQFLAELKSKARHKKRLAELIMEEAKAAESNYDEAESHKKTSIWQKAKNLVDKAGGIQGASQTAENILKWWKAPSDTSISVGATDEDLKPEKNLILGLNPFVFYTSCGVVALLGIWGVSRLVKQKTAVIYQTN